jgi:hypothetical protein
MKATVRLAAVVLSALLGIALCIGAIRADEALHLVPHLPTPGGESDFSVRAALFFGLACPALAGLGGYLGWVAAAEPRRAARGWGGVLLATAACFGLVAAFPLVLLGLARIAGGNVAFALFLCTWVMLAFSLALLLARRRVQGAPSSPGRPG